MDSPVGYCDFAVGKSDQFAYLRDRVVSIYVCLHKDVFFIHTLSY